MSDWSFFNIVDYLMVVYSSDYKMYMMTFDGVFHILQVTSKPLCDGSGNSCTYQIYFPCGLVYNQMNDTWALMRTGWVS